MEADIPCPLDVPDLSTCLSSLRTDESDLDNTGYISDIGLGSRLGILLTRILEVLREGIVQRGNLALDIKVLLDGI